MRLNPVEVKDGGTSGTTEASARRGIGLEWVKFGNGVPSNSMGSDGWFYFRFDGTKAGNTVIYHKEVGVWIALITT